MTRPSAFGSEIFDLVSAGDGYLAAEKAMVLVRKLKKEGKDTEAMIYLMETAILMGEKKLWGPSVQLAKRSIEMFPRSATSINCYLSKLFHSFADQADKDAYGPDLRDFYTALIMIFPRETEQYMRKEAKLSCEAGVFYESLGFELSMMTLLEEAECNERCVGEIETQLLPVWCESLKDREYEEQFVIAKCVLGVAATGPDTWRLAQALFEKANGGRDAPLLNFTRLFLKALEQGHEPSMAFLLNRYAQWLEQDADLKNFAAAAKRRRLPPAQGWNFDGLTQMMNSLLGGFPGMTQ